MSQNGRRRFSESTIYQEIFDEIVLLAVKKGLASGTVLYTDSTHLKANANKNKYDVAEVQVKPQEYLAALEAAIGEDRAAHGKKPLKEQPVAAPETKQIKVSRTDADSDYMVRNGKPKGFFYLDHRTVDGHHAIITDTHVVPANVHDSVPYLGRLDRQQERFGFGVRAVGVDAGYAAAAITQGLEERNIYGVIGYRTPMHRDGYFHKREYRYDKKLDVYICPNGHRPAIERRIGKAAVDRFAVCLSYGSEMPLLPDDWSHAHERGKTGRHKKRGADLASSAQHICFRRYAAAFFAVFADAFAGGFGTIFLAAFAFSFSANSCLILAVIAATSTL